MGEAAEVLHMTLVEYVAFENDSANRHEYVNGVAYAMAGGSPEHARIGTNLTIALGVRLRGGPCRPINGDQRLFVPATEASFYPDLTIVCGPQHYADHDAAALINPTVLFEVLSPSTANDDRGAKLEHYFRLESLRTYVVVYQDTPLVTVHERQPDGAWLRRDYTEGTVPLPAIGVDLPFDEIYDLTNLR